MIQLLAGDCRDVLATLPAESVQCVVTSPPYYGLRDYGTALWDGGDAACDHLMPSNPQTAYATGRCSGEAWAPPSKTLAFEGKQFRDTCGKCGARRIDRQIGLEATPESYLATMVAVFREVRRVLRKDGTLWLNIGDSYASGPAGNKTPSGISQNRPKRLVADLDSYNTQSRNHGDAKHKDLLMMPARLALALQADGWWVRSDIIWHKPNPMPESCTDRPTSAHEHVFLLTRSARYYYDAEAVREPSLPESTERQAAGFNGNDRGNNYRAGYFVRDGWQSTTRNLRNVWTLPTHPYAQAHFATYPPQLAERCIRAGTSERGACSQCGKPWVRVTERSVAFTSGSGKAGNVPNGKHQGSVQALSGDYDIRMGPSVATTTTGWSPACACNAGDPVPCKVLDPFIGAGTTALVADRLQRDCIGIDLNVAYTEMAMQRCRDDAPLFTAFPPAEDPEEARMQDLFADMAAE